MKRVSIFSLLVALVLLSCAAFAATQSFHHFSLYVPSDWRAEEVDVGDVRLYDRYADEEQIYVRVNATDSSTLETHARALYNTYSGRNFTRDNNRYTFTYDFNGLTWTGIVFDNQTNSALTSSYYCYMSVTNDTDPEDFGDVFDSIALNSGGGGG